MMTTLNIYKAPLIAASLLLSFAGTAQADISVLQKIRFGEVIITNNNMQHSITVNPDGAFNHASSLINITDPQQGIYQIDDLTPNTLINVTASQLQPLSGSGNFFNLTDFQIVHTNSDASGLTNITLGATAQTSGNSLAYDNRTYNGTIQIQISY